MSDKTKIAALQEYCAKKKLSLPNYEWRSATDGSKSFVCIVSAVNEMAEGVGRSKQEAKHDAAANIIAKLKITCPDIENIPQVHFETIPTSDAVDHLTQLCRRTKRPLPSFHLVEVAGFPHAPKITFACRVADIERRATASSKKAARQLAAKEMIKILEKLSAAGMYTENASVNQVAKETEELNRYKIEVYREFKRKEDAGLVRTVESPEFPGMKVYVALKDPNVS